MQNVVVNVKMGAISTFLHDSIDADLLSSEYRFCGSKQLANGVVGVDVFEEVSHLSNAPLIKQE